MLMDETRFVCLSESFSSEAHRLFYIPRILLRIVCVLFNEIFSNEKMKRLKKFIPFFPSIKSIAEILHELKHQGRISNRVFGVR